tara:strand:- start:685 stop:855 length:171 start_codon:yes stop_codon:yes gene_type:complete
MGWRELEIEIGGSNLHISCPPDTNLDNHFVAFCHDEQEIIAICGWLIDELEEIEDE